MRFPGALLMLLVAEVFFVHATLNNLLRPFQSLLSWRESTKNENTTLGIKNRDAARERANAKQEVDHWTQVDASQIFAPETSNAEKGTQGLTILFEDFNTTASSEPTKASSPADSPDQTTLSSNLATSTTPPSGHPTSVTSPAETLTSVRSVSAPPAAAKNFHMVDLKIPGGESPDTETLPDVASFEPNKSLESVDKAIEKLSELSGADLEELKNESQSMNRGLPLSPIAGLTSTPTAAPPTTTTTEIPVTAASRETIPSSRSTKEDSVREPDQKVKHPARSFVFQDVNDLFQSDD